MHDHKRSVCLDGKVLAGKAVVASYVIVRVFCATFRLLIRNEMKLGLDELRRRKLDMRITHCYDARIRCNKSRVKKAGEAPPNQLTPEVSSSQS